MVYMDVMETEFESDIFELGNRMSIIQVGFE